MVCGLVVGDAQPHQLLEDYVEWPADEGLDLSEMLPLLQATHASLAALGDDPFPQLQKWLPKQADPVAEALREVMADMSVALQCGPMPGASSHLCRVLCWCTVLSGCDWHLSHHSCAQRACCLVVSVRRPLPVIHARMFMLSNGMIAAQARACGSRMRDGHDHTGCSVLAKHGAISTNVCTTGLFTDYLVSPSQEVRILLLATALACSACLYRPVISDACMQVPHGRPQMNSIHVTHTLLLVLQRPRLAAPETAVGQQVLQLRPPVHLSRTLSQHLPSPKRQEMLGMQHR